MVKAFTTGQMVVSMKGNGEMVRWKAKEPIHGLMARNTQEIIRRIERKVKGLLNGQMAANMLALGKMGNRMDLGGFFKEKNLYSKGLIEKVNLLIKLSL